MDHQAPDQGSSQILSSIYIRLYTEHYTSNLQPSSGAPRPPSPEAVLVVEVEEGLLLLQALSRHAGLAHFVRALHAPDRRRHLSADDTPLGFLRCRVVRIAPLSL